MANPNRVTIHVAFATIVIFSVLLSPVWAGGMMEILHQRYLNGLGIAAFGLFFILWICSATVYLDDERLTYSTFFFIRRSVKLETITHVNVLSNPAPTLVLRGNQSAFKFIIKPFSKAGVSFIMRHIRFHAPGAEFDNISSDLEQGDFKSVTRETLHAQNLFQVFGTVFGLSLVVSLAQATIHLMPLTVAIIVAAVLFLGVMTIRKTQR